MKSTYPYELTTPRLGLAPLEESDIEALHTLWTAPPVRYFLWDDMTIPWERTAAVVTESARLFKTHGFGLWGARFHGTRDLVGFGGFWAFRPPVFELVYGIAADHWGNGLATELAGVLIRYSTERLGWTEVRASTDAPNRGSIRVLEKLGFRCEERALLDGLDTLFYRLDCPRHPPGGSIR